MHSQTLQTLRSEIEAVATMQHALGQIGRQVDESKVRNWHGPGPEDITDYADDEGGFSRDAVAELRTRAGQALAERYREVSELVENGNGHSANLRTLLHSVMSIGTGVAEGADPAHTLKELATEGALRLERAVEAANLARSHLEEPLDLVLPPRISAPRKAHPVKKAAAGKKAAAKKKPVAKKAAAPKAKSAKKTKRVVASKKAKAKKKSR